MRTYLSRSWISPKLAAGRSRIHGVGVIAKAAIARGERLMEFGGQAMAGDEVDIDVHRVRSIWQVDDDLYLALPLSDTEPSLDENLNHACEANGWLADEVNLVARTDIAPGEEITLDQGTWNFSYADGQYTVDQDHCSCGSPHCRCRLTESDWTLPQVRERYRGHFHPLIQRMIEKNGRQ